MPQALSGAVPRPLAGGTLTAYVDRTVRTLASSFVSTKPYETERAIHWILLGMVLVGAAIVRFWGLGVVGFHGDEETMAMAVRGILEQGAPILPSGMFYPRGLTQLGLMSVSAAIFGESEWALRLPSAVCGIVLVPIGYFAGRRFLRPAWGLVLAAALAFLPELIIYSQTARMYIFLVTFIAVALVCVFAWERSGHVRWLVGAIVALIFGLEMHSLAIASVLMMLFPGAVHGDMRKLAIGTLAMFAVSLGFVGIELFVNAQYPDPPSDLFGGANTLDPGAIAAPALAIGSRIAYWLAGLAVAYLAARVVKGIASTQMAVIAAAVLVAGVGLQFALFYHLAVLCYLAGLVIVAREGVAWTSKRVLTFGVGVGVIALCHAWVLAPIAGTFVRLVGALNGHPSTWPYVRLAGFSVGAAILCVGLMGWGMWRISRRLPVPEYWLLTLLGVWAPVFALGLFAWNVPVRYTAMSLIPLLICAIAFAQATLDQWRTRVSAGLEAGCAAAVALVVVNPLAAAATIDGGYRIYPDHKGAAEYMRSVGLTDDDVVLAEDVLQQTYYLGRVDYWLIGPDVARRFVMKSEAGIVDFYTGTPVVVTTDMLDEVLQTHRDKRVFIIGSGEDWRRGRRETRGELHAAIESARFETVFRGRDGLTRVLRAVPAATPAPQRKQTAAQSEAKLQESAEKLLGNDALSITPAPEQAQPAGRQVAPAPAP